MSIVLALLIMRGGVLVLAPLMDLAFGRRVRWFAWTGFALALVAVATIAAGGTALRLGWATRRDGRPLSPRLRLSASRR